MGEESGVHDVGGDLVVIIDPIDGSTNASRGLPWYATSLCVVDGDGARVALVVDQAGGSRFEAVRGGGAHVDGRPLAPTGCTELGDALVGLSGLPPWWFGRSEEHTSELQSLMRISYAVFCLKKKKRTKLHTQVQI